MAHKFTLFIYNNYTTAVYNAYRFALAALEQGYELSYIFLWRDSVVVANQYLELAGDEINLQSLWQELSLKYNLKLQVCRASASRRGIQEKNLAPNFSFGSIGVLSQYLTTEYKLMSF